MEFLYLLLGIIAGFVVSKALLNKTLAGLQQESKVTLEQAKQKADDMLHDAEGKFRKLQQESKEKERGVRKEMEAKQSKLLKREQDLENQLDALDKERLEIDKNLQITKETQGKYKEMLTLQDQQLQKISGMTQEQAKDFMFEKVQSDHAELLADYAKSLISEVKKDSVEKSKMILALAMQKNASEIASENTSTIVDLPSDDMKGRIIGKEGRNIQSFERLTGVDVVVDDTPGVVLISGFDLKRRYIAKIALERLVSDGRIHPARIEEVVLKVQEEVDELIDNLGEKAAYKAGVAGLPPEILTLLGRLKFRTNNGQNVLKQSIEVANLAAVLAAELNVDTSFVKRVALLNSIGKAVNHEVSGKYSEVGADIIRKFGLADRLALAVAEVVDPSDNLPAIVVNIAYNLVCSRPGIGKNNFETFVSRLTELENIAKSFGEVSEAFAINNGNQVRVIANVDKVDDLRVMTLAVDISKKIESDMQYSGQVKVHVLREKRLEAEAS